MADYKIRKQSIPYNTRLVPFRRLAFYPDNPRVYSQFVDDADRTQERIEAKMVGLDHVRELRASIDRDGQVNDPLLVVPVDDVDPSLGPDLHFVVLEGNRRLAALRLTGRPIIPPAEVRCHILDFSAHTPARRDSLIFSLLGQLHIERKKDWEPFERAAFIRRRHEIHKIPLDDLANEIGLGERKLKSLIEAHQMMENYRDTKRSNWSFYDAYVASTSLRKQRDNIPDLDETVARYIKRGDFRRAMDMRDRLPAILENKSARKIFLREMGESPFQEALERAEATGSTNDTLKQLKRFRKKISAAETKSAIRKLLENPGTSGPTDFELRKIQRVVERALKMARN